MTVGNRIAAGMALGIAAAVLTNPFIAAPASIIVGAGLGVVLFLVTVPRGGRVG